MNYKLSRHFLIWVGLFLTVFSSSAFAEEAGLDKMITDTVGPFMEPFVATIFYSVTIPGLGIAFPLIVGWLVVAATIFTLYFGFIQFRAFGHSLALVSGKYSDPNDAGEVSHFQALATALSGTVGLGNIAGVAVAVSIGGPGATFWMILAGLLGMASKFTECTLGVKYRNEYEDGTVSGGPMYYLSKGMSESGSGAKAALGKVLAVMFAIFCILGSWGGGNMFQANQAHSQLVNITGGADSFLNGNGWITGVILAAIVFAVIVGGLKSIARVTEKVVPFMAVIYVTAAVVILVMNADKIGWAFGQIFAGAFTGLGIAGGLVGALIQGFKRAAFSNEAGVGSAAIAHSAVRTKEPITEGYVSLLEPFIDTVVICTMTALVIVITGVLTADPATGLYAWDAAAGRIATEGGLSGVELTSAAFATSFSWFPYVLALAVLLFAFSTMISWSYYGLKAWTYLFGEGHIKELIFKILFCIFVIIGAAMNLGIVIDFSDAAIFAMALVNIVGLYFLMPIVKAEMQSYNARLKSGEIRRYK
ncbi:MAG: alanine/glycine:cation symporter family protein [Thiolinea sp.]